MISEDKSTILIVDDVRTNINLLSEIFKNEYLIKATNNGVDALRIAKTNPKPDIILLDIMMPEMNGYQVCQSLKESPDTENIPIIFITAVDDERDEEYGLNLGAIDYITKPFIPNLVKARVKNNIDRYVFQKQLNISLEKVNKAYKELEESQDKIIKLEQKNTVLAMAVTANHEINQPLAIISNSSELLRMKIDDEKLNSYLDKIDNSVVRIHSILSKFKNLNEVSFKRYLDETNMLDINKE